MGAPKRRLPEALVLATSAVVILFAGAMNRSRSASNASGATAPSALTLAPLPAGATARPVDAVDMDIEAGCNFPDRGFGPYLGWRPLPLGRLLIPATLTLT